MCLKWLQNSGWSNNIYILSASLSRHMGLIFKNANWKITNSKRPTLLNWLPSGALLWAFLQFPFQITGFLTCSKICSFEFFVRKIWAFKAQNSPGTKVSVRHNPCVYHILWYFFAQNSLGVLGVDNAGAWLQSHYRHLLTFLNGFAKIALDQFEGRAPSSKEVFDQDNRLHQLSFADKGAIWGLHHQVDGQKLTEHPNSLWPQSPNCPRLLGLYLNSLE